ncbi:MAG: DUF5706 domain-containing protein [Spirosomataceae bacterium]
MEASETPVNKPKKEKKKKQSRSVETMFRTTMSNHIQLSGMADQKAGLMVSTNSIIISITITFLVQHFGANPKLLLPTTLLVVVCLLTITFALLSTRPNVKSKSERLSIEKSKIDLLFFGDYLALSREEYTSEMKQLLSNDNQLHNAMIENIYAQGSVVERKYKLLKIAYSIFIIGFPMVLCYYLIVLYWG